MAATENRDYPLPDPSASVADEFWRLVNQTLPMIDADVAALLLALAGKAAKDHPHAIGDVEGLAFALEGKMPANTALNFAGLQDVEGFGAAPDGYIPIKSGTRIIMMAALAALGDHAHTIGQVNGLSDALSARLAKGSNLSDLADAVAARRNLKIWTGTEAQYDAIGAKDAATLYFIT